jgi:hypothetical protein
MTDVVPDMRCRCTHDIETAPSAFGLGVLVKNDNSDIDRRYDVSCMVHKGSTGIHSSQYTHIIKGDGWSGLMGAVVIAPGKPICHLSN